MLQSINASKIVALNTYATAGGAARAAMRLNTGLRQAGLDLAAISRETYLPPRYGHNHKSRWLSWLLGCLDILPCKLYPNSQVHNFSSNWMPDGIGRKLRHLTPDLIHLHWIGDGFLRIESLARFEVPIVWTLHDSWPFTGGCHLPGGCRRYQESCGCCPVLGSSRIGDLSRWVWSRKRAAWANLNLTCVAPSHWLAECVLTSSLLSCRRVEVIPNGVDASIYCPGDRLAARSALGLTTKRQLILFGANHALSDRNKGFDLLQNALSKLSPRQVAQTELVLFGDDTALPFSCTMPVRNLGVVRDEARIVQLYQAADIFVIPSRQENLPNMILEAMACGIPCVAFSVGGIPDLITHGVDGYLATPGDSGDLSRGIACLLEDDSRREMIAARARRKVETKFTLQHSVERYLTLYRELMAE